MLRAAVYDLKLDRGATFRRVLKLRQTNGQPVNLTQYTLTGTVRAVGLAEAPPVTNLGVSFETTGLDGGMVLYLSPAQTEALTKLRYAYDVRLTHKVSGDVWILLKGVMEVA